MTPIVIVVSSLIPTIVRTCERRQESREEHMTRTIARILTLLAATIVDLIATAHPQ